MYRTTKELIALKKEDIWFFYDESDRIDYLIHTYGRTRRLKFQQDEIRRFIDNAHYELDQLEWDYQEEQRQAEVKKRLQAETKRRQQAESRELQKATHEFVSICSSIKDDVINLLAHIRAEKEQEQEKEETQEQDNEDVCHSGVANNCDVSMKILEVPTTEPTIVSKLLETTDSRDEHTEILEVPQVEKVEPEVVLEVEPEIVCKQQTDENFQVAFELVVVEEKTVRKVDPVQADHVEFIIPDNLLQRPLNAKVILSSVIFPTFFEPYRVKVLAMVFQDVFSMKKSSWFILSCYKTRGRVFSNKGRNDGDQDQVYYLVRDLMYLIIYGSVVMLVVK